MRNGVSMPDQNGQRDVVRLRSARQFAGRWAYYLTAAYWVDGLLIDTGCAHTAEQLASALDDVGIERVVKTHGHEDHIGANSYGRAKYNCPVLAHSVALLVFHCGPLLRVAAGPVLSG